MSTPTPELPPRPEWNADHPIWKSFSAWDVAQDSDDMGDTFTVMGRAVEESMRAYALSAIAAHEAARPSDRRLETLMRAVNDARQLMDPIWHERMGAESVREYVQRGLRCIDSAMTDIARISLATSDPEGHRQAIADHEASRAAPADLIRALRAGEQADADGTFVKVSREACELAADLLSSRAAPALSAPPAAEPVAWRALGGEWNIPQDMEYRYGPWVEGLDPLRFQPLYAALPASPPVGEQVNDPAAKLSFCSEHRSPLLSQSPSQVADRAGSSFVGEPVGKRAEPVPSVAQEPGWRDHVEQRLLTWRRRFMNGSGDQLALDDFMDKESLADLIDFVCDEWATPPSPAQGVATPVPEAGASGVRIDLTALVHDLVVETERAMKQRDEFLKTGVSTAGHGGSHDTCFGLILDKHLVTSVNQPSASSTGAEAADGGQA